MSNFTLASQQSVAILARAFAEELSKHKLKRDMTADEILNLLDLGNHDSQPIPPPAAVYEGDLSDLPEGLSKKRAAAILALCEQGVPDGQYVHVVHAKVFTPNLQHKDFLKNDKARIAGPVSKDEKKGKKDTKIIKWLAKKAGKVNPPVEPEVEARTPSKWGIDGKKKARNMIKKVDARKDDTKYINWISSRAIVGGNDDMIYDDNLMICGPMSEKATFLNLVAWIEENPEVLEEEEKKVTKKAAKAKTDKKKAAKAKKEEPSEESQTEVTEEEDEEEPSAEEEGGELEEPSDEGEEEEGDEEEGDEEEGDEEEEEEEEGDDDQDGSTSGEEDDEDHDDDSDSPSTKSPKSKKAKVVKLVDGYNEKKLATLTKNIANAKESGKWVHAGTRRNIKRTPETEAKFEFVDSLRLAIPKESTDVKTSWLVKEYKAMIKSAQ